MADIDRRNNRLELKWWWLNPIPIAIGTEIRNPKGFPGLISLKGGDLNQEIGESKTGPGMVEIFEIFPEDYFREKYILYIPKISSQTPL
jgi:16S rRNA (guanine527-N7)-methyltransferase